MKYLLSLLLSAFVYAAQAQTAYKIAGPYEVVARDGQYAYTKGGSERDMWTAWQLASEKGKVNNEGFTTALKIVNAYAQTLQRFDGHDAPLCCIQAYWLVRAMTLLNDESRLKNDELAAAKAMVRRAVLPVLEQFEADSPYANGNWGAIVNRCRMACAIFLEDSTLYRASVDYFLYANDNGSLPNYISETGQCQETGRDQAHAQLGLGALCDICEMAWEYGESVNCKSVNCKYHDLWGALDNRLMKGLEYTARYNLGYDVPFETWQDCTGLYCDWTEPGSMQRGRVRCIYDAAYNHYTQVRHLKMPYVKRLLELQRKAEQRGEISDGMEARMFSVKGVEEGERLHQVFTYPAPAGAPLKHDYEVYVQARGNKEWTRIDTYMAKVNAPIGDSKHRQSEISYAQFDFTGSVLVRVVTKNKKYKSVRVRPKYRGVIANVQNDSTVQFMLFQPENVSVEFDGDITDNLLLFTSKPPITKEQAEKEAREQGRRFICFPPGLYSQADIDSICHQSPLRAGLPPRPLGSGVGDEATVYLAPGSYFTGTFAIEDARDVSILGRGIARPQSGYEGCHVHRSRNVLIDGLTVNTCPVGGSDGVTLRNVRSISHPGWGDGLNVFASQNVLFDRVFCRNSDDCTTAYASRKGFFGNCRNVTMRNSTLWADVAHPIFIGIHGNAERGDTIENLRYENIDILCQSEPQVDYQGCLAINCGDNNLVRNVTFDNIRIEQIHQGCLLQVKVGYNQKYCAAPGRGVENVTFRNIRYEGEQPNLSIINGYDSERKVEGITFEGIRINGRLLHDKMKGKPAWYSTADYIPMFVGNHVENVAFSADAQGTLVSQSLSYCSSQVDRALETLRPYDFTMMPRNILNDGKTWNLRKASLREWCSGFWPGILWMDFAYNKSEAIQKAAKGYTDALLPVVAQPVHDHDLGFITNALVKGYEASKDERYREAALLAADSLATLFNPAVGTMLSWPRHIKDYGGHNTIIDNMMNLELLFWAAREKKDERVKSERLYHVALSHAETTMKHGFRKDGSCYHVAVYDTLTGKFIKGMTHQGYSDNSMWCRGQAWAIYGYTMVYRFTKDKRFLNHARKVTDIYLKRLKETSDDCIPRWDMDAPDSIKDVSAACIIASALIELSEYVSADQADTYRDFAIKTLHQLSSRRYQSRDKNFSFLLHATGHHPAGSEIDASIIYADYYYLEALLRLRDSQTY